MDIKQGNNLIFLLFIISNFSVFLASLGILGCAIYLIAITKSGNLINISFLLISISLLVITTYAFRLRKSIHMLGCYLVIQFVVFCTMLILSFILLFDSDLVAEYANEVYNQEKAENPDMSDSLESYIQLMEQNINSVGLALLFFTFIVGITVAFGYCYRNSIIDKTF